MRTRNVWPPLTTRPTLGNAGSGRSGSLASSEPRGVEVTLVVVHRHERQVVQPGERARERDAHEQRARQARALGDRDRLDPRQSRGPGPPACLVEDRDHPAQVRPCRHLRHDAAGRGVQGDLARDDVGQDPAPAPPRPRRPSRRTRSRWPARGRSSCRGPSPPASATSPVSAVRRREAARSVSTRACIAGVSSASVVMIRASSPLSE